MQLIPASTQAQYSRIETLYQTAFPACERKPFSLILEKQAAGQVDLFVLEQDTLFSGLAITMKHQDLVLLDYFAIDNARRQRGLGSRALSALFEYYSEKRFFLEIESTQEAAENKAQRLLRKQFYLKNKMTELGFYANVFGTEMELLSYQSLLTYEEYIGIYQAVYGPEKAACIKRLP